MNANDLYGYLKNGAILKTRRYFNPKPRFIHTLTLKDGTNINVQRSAIDSLIRNALIRSIYLRASQTDYEVIHYDPIRTD